MRSKPTYLFLAAFVCFAWTFPSSYIKDKGDDPKSPKKEENKLTLDTNFHLEKVITGNITPKSIVHNGNGLFFAQNMMYKHTITVYNREFNLVKSIPDKVKLSEYGWENYTGQHRGAPVEATFSHNGKYAWISNYQMQGEGFEKPGCDTCVTRGIYDSSFVYKINTLTLELENVIKVGAVPKFLATSYDDKYVLVTNWTSGDLSIISTEKNEEIKRLRIGRYPRGIVTHPFKSIAYVAIMGSNKIAVVDLEKLKVTKHFETERGPRHLCISPDGEYLYATLNHVGKVGKISLKEPTKQTLIRTGRLPRSMTMSEDGELLYVVNYGSGTVSKISTANMKVEGTAETYKNPIGITFDNEKGNVWVACYSGSIMVIKDKAYTPPKSLLASINDIDISKVTGFVNTYFGPDKSQLVFYAYEGIKEEIKKNPDLLAFSINTNKSEKEEPEEIVEKTEPKTKPVAPVKKESPPTKVPTTSTGNYHVVVGSFSVQSNAEKLVKELIKEGYEAKELESDKQGFTYAVLGSYSNRNEAQKALNQYKDKGWILKR